MALATATVVPAQAEAAPTNTTPAEPGVTVTLVTGDKVTLSGSQRVDVKAGQGRPHIGITRDGTQWKAIAFHPADAKFASLRTNIADPEGDSQRQTIIRAYALR